MAPGCGERATTTTGGAGSAPSIKLAVLVVFDQFRGDYLPRWGKLMAAGGFQRLQREGASFTSCHYPYAYTATAPGHASLATGCAPRVHGIIANDWFDRGSRAYIFAVRSERYEPVPPLPKKRPGGTPERRRAPSIGEALHDASRGKGKVVSLSIKDRAAILLAALRASLCFWFFTDTGRFGTSTYYTDVLPEWMREFNDSGAADRWFGRDWTRLRADLDYTRHSGADDVAEEGTGVDQGRTFPHPMTGGLKTPGPRYYEALINSPFANGLLLDLAKKAIDAEQLGQRDAPDLLCLSFSANDNVGHCWGPDSHEVLDTTLRSDLIVKDLMEYLDAKAGKDRYLLIVTGDHGICPLPAVARQQGKDAGRVDGDVLGSRAIKYLNDTLNAGKKPVPWLENAEGGWWYLNQNVLRELGLPSEKVQKHLAQWLRQQDGLHGVWTRAELSQGAMSDPIAERVRQSFHPENSGDLMIVPKAHWLFSPALATGTDHGTPHDYDTHVPLLVYGPGIRPGARDERVSPLIVPAIIARALGIPPPAMAEAGVPERLK